MGNVVIILICLLVCSFAFFAFYLASKERAERKQTEEEIQRLKENETKAAETVTEANKTKADARTGDIERDVNYMANRLHEYAKK